MTEVFLPVIYMYSCFNEMIGNKKLFRWFKSYSVLLKLTCDKFNRQDVK